MVDAKGPICGNFEPHERHQALFDFDVQPPPICEGVDGPPSLDCSHGHTFFDGTCVRCGLVWAGSATRMTMR